MPDENALTIYPQDWTAGKSFTSLFECAGADGGDEDTLTLGINADIHTAIKSGPLRVTLGGSFSRPAPEIDVIVKQDDYD